MTFEEQIHIKASPEKIFALYRDVNNWQTWDPEVKESGIENDFALGTKGFLTPKSGFRNNFMITEIENDKCFTVRIRLPLCSMFFEHELEPVSSGTEVVHRIRFSGPLGSLFGTLLGKKLIREQLRTMHALQKKAEQAN